MKIAEREQQILRVKATSFQPELDEALEQALQTAVLEAIKTTLETALKEEIKAELAKLLEDRPRRSGYFERGLDTQYGHLSNLRVPKLRRRNKEREWQILQRYQRELGNLLNWLCCVYVMQQFQIQEVARDTDINLQITVEVKKAQKHDIS